MPTVEASPGWVLVLVLLVLPAAATAEEPTTRKGSYVVGVTTAGVCLPASVPSVNTVCLAIPQGAGQVALSIQDEVRDSACGHYEFYDAVGNVLQGGDFLDDASGIVVPDDAVEVGVFPGAHQVSDGLTYASDTATCPEGKGVYGNVTATFT